jgi:hypothetical protein
MERADRHVAVVEGLGQAKRRAILAELTIAACEREPSS